MIIFFCIVLYFKCTGQYFNVSHDIYSNIETAYNLEKRDSAYLIFAGTRDSNNHYAGLYLSKINDNGLVQDSNIFFLNNKQISDDIPLLPPLHNLH